VIVATDVPNSASRIYTIDIYNGKQVMARPVAGSPAGSPVVANHAIFVATRGTKSDYVISSLWQDRLIGSGYNNKSGGRGVCVAAGMLFVLNEGGILRAHGKVDLRPKESVYERMRRQNEELYHRSPGALH